MKLICAIFADLPLLRRLRPQLASGCPSYCPLDRRHGCVPIIPFLFYLRELTWDGPRLTRSTAVEGIACYIEFTFHADAFLSAARLTPFITSILTITLALNIFATGVLASSLSHSLTVLTAPSSSDRVQNLDHSTRYRGCRLHEQLRRQHWAQPCGPHHRRVWHLLLDRSHHLFHRLPREQ